MRIALSSRYHFTIEKTYWLLRLGRYGFGSAWPWWQRKNTTKCNLCGFRWNTEHAKQHWTKPHKCS